MTSDVLFETPAVAHAPVAAAGQVGVHGDVVEASSCTPVLEIHIVGVPAPQGSKSAFTNKYTGKAQMKESSAKTLAPWRQDVKTAAIDAIAASGYMPPSETVGVSMHVTFLLARPKGHFRTGRNAHLLRDGAPLRPTTRPDVDKLLRSTLDALKVAGVYRDDSHVVTVTGRKVYAREHTGAIIHVYTGEAE
jgi:Holliday junction resolvase RusA-like endonuclease